MKAPPSIEQGSRWPRRPRLATPTRLILGAAGLVSTAVAALVPLAAYLGVPGEVLSERTTAVLQLGTILGTPILLAVGLRWIHAAWRGRRPTPLRPWFSAAIDKWAHNLPDF